MYGHNYQNIPILAAYIKSIDPTHPVINANTAGAPPCSGSGYNCAAGQTQINNLFSCNGQAPCNGVYPWMTDPNSPITGFDYYPVCVATNNGGMGGCGTGGQSADDIGQIATNIAATIAANYAPEKMIFVEQSFSWYQEGGPGCTSLAVCPFPTTAQMQTMRDQALYYANKAGKPLSMILWYYWKDVTCNNETGGLPTHYPGCSEAANRAAVKAAAFAAFPATPPP